MLGLLALVALIGALSPALGLLVMIAVMVAVWILPAWRWYTRLGATVGAFFLLLIGAGLSGQLENGGTGKYEAGAQDAKPADVANAGDTPSPAASKTLDFADYTGRPLHEAEKAAHSAGLAPDRHDAADEDRTVVMRSGWTVCFQKADNAARTIDFAAVKTGEPCPEKDGGPLPWPMTPDLVGDTYNTAVEKLDQAGIDLDRVTLDDVYLDLGTPTAAEAAEKGDKWRVCFQTPDEDTKVTSSTTVRLDLGKWTDADLVQGCPSAKDTTYKIPANDPAHNDSASDNSTGGGGSADDDPSSSGSSTDSSGGVVHPGSYCSPPGATGVTKKGTPMVCGPGSDGRDRWHS
ncbi:hypothetical protein A4U61_04360 [Streptomyces sp. H-KF8]|nr:hypothetical protein A4U61_04360 [Streptomyces sp. H-KF8]